jgi:hypothetical protein
VTAFFVIFNSTFKKLLEYYIKIGHKDLLPRPLQFYTSREYGRGDASRWPRSTLYLQKLSLTSPTSGGRSVGIVRSRTQTMEFLFFIKKATNK